MDKQQLEEIINGNEAAYDAFYRAYYDKLYRIAYRMTNCDADAKDAVQETFIQIQKSLKDVKQIEYLDYWLTKVVLSKCKRIFRKNKDAYYDPHTLFDKAKQMEHRKYMLPKDRVDNMNQQKLLYELLNELPDIHKEVLVLFYFEQYKYKEIAQILGVSEGTVKGRIHYAKENLRKTITEFEKKHDCKFDYQVVDPVLASLLLSLGIGKLSFFANYTKKVGKQGFKYGYMLVVSTCVVTSTAFIIQAKSHQQRYAQEETTVSIERAESMPIKGFEVIYREQKITNPKDAYFTLLLWANTEEQIMAKTDAEVLEIKKVYDRLKEENGIYFEKLRERKWNEVFEKKLAEIL